MASIWETRFNNHALWTVLDQTRQQLNDIEMPSNVDGADSLARMIWLAELLQAHRENDDIRGYTPTMLENVHRMLAGNVQNQLIQYMADTDTYAANLNTAAQQVDSVLDQMGTWPPLPPKRAAIAAGRRYSKYEQATNAALQTLTVQRDELLASLSEMRRTIELDKASLQTALTQFESEADAAIQERLEEVSSKYLSEVKDSIESINTDRGAASDVRSELTQMSHEGKNILEAVANKAVANNYRRNARNKSIAGWFWDVFGLVIGGASVTLLLVHLFDENAADTSTALALTRLAVSIAGVGLAALCFQRGGGNHKEARRAKRADIRLSTVEPFIVNQDDEFKDAIMEGMADRIYLQGILDTEDSSHDASLYEQALKRVRERKRTAARDAAEEDA